MVIELATTMVLLTGAGLLGKSLYRLLHVDVGFQVDHLSTLQVRLPDARFPATRSRSLLSADCWNGSRACRGPSRSRHQRVTRNLRLQLRLGPDCGQAI